MLSCHFLTMSYNFNLSTATRFRQPLQLPFILPTLTVIHSFRFTLSTQYLFLPQHVQAFLSRLWDQVCQR